jgi:predicted enzyme related to lactoylglutathione lyase
VKKDEGSVGRILLPKTIASGFGFLTILLDTEKNTFGLWQMDSSTKN